MKKILATFYISLIAFSALGQGTSGIWKPSKKEYFTKIEQMLTTPDRFSAEDYADVYYGFSTLRNYKGDNDEIHLDVENFLFSGEFDKAWMKGMDNLKINPVSLRNLKATILAGIGLKLSENEMMLYVNYFLSIMSAIAESGDGSSCETAYKVLSVADEYVFLFDFLDAESFERQSLVSLMAPSCDALYYIDKYGMEQVAYFDFSIPFAKRTKKPLSKMY